MFFRRKSYPLKRMIRIDRTVMTLVFQSYKMPIISFNRKRVDKEFGSSVNTSMKNIPCNSRRIKSVMLLKLGKKMKDRFPIPCFMKFENI